MLLLGQVATPPTGHELGGQVQIPYRYGDPVGAVDAELLWDRTGGVSWTSIESNTNERVLDTARVGEVESLLAEHLGFVNREAVVGQARATSSR